MKQLILITISVLITIISFGQVDIKGVNKSLVKITDQLYASKYEVSNEQYIAFINSLKRSNKINLLSIAQIDTLKWKSKLTYNEPYVRYYHTHPAYENYPVVNISYEAAMLFCEWLTEQYNLDSNRKYKKVFFRLPTEKEWVLAAKAGDSSAIYPWQGNKLSNKKGEFMSRSAHPGDAYAYKKQDPYCVDITAPVKSYWSNKFGLYNMSGNVAEMIAEKGITKGGSWNVQSESEYFKIDAKYKYDGNAQTFIGFRYFAEILEK